MRPETELMMHEALFQAVDGETALAERILQFERLHWKYPAAKEDAIRQRFALSATHYYQVLNSLADTEAAYRLDPTLVKRIRAKRLSRIRIAGRS